MHTKDKAAAQSMMDHLKDGIDHAAHIGVDRAYVVPGEVDDDLSINDYGVYYSKLAEYAQSRGVMIGIEHFPRKAFPTIQSTLEFIKEINHPNLYLLFDLGHAQISKEDPVQWLPEAGDRLLYVHLDDNDGINDLHLPLTEGVQTREDLESLFKVLGELNYQGPVSLELHPLLPNHRHGQVKRHWDSRRPRKPSQNHRRRVEPLVQGPERREAGGAELESDGRCGEWH